MAKKPNISNAQKEEHLRRLKEIALSKGGLVLSDKYINGKTKLRFQCEKGHKWDATPQSIKEGTWCPICYRGISKHLKELKKIVERKGGKLLSKVYVNAHTPVNFQCGLGHQWSAKPNAIKNGTWCPTCNESSNEEYCRCFFQRIFNKSFPKARFEWLINEEGNPMHLDGFNTELKLAFEYNGIQHYKFHKFFHRSKEEFEKRKRDDNLKKKLCEEHNIKLIIVSYLVSLDEMENDIRKQGAKLGYIIQKGTKKLNWRKFKITQPNKLEELQEIAKSRAGELVSDHYYNNRTNLKFRCRFGHEWEATPYRIKSGTWCPHCYQNELKELKQEKKRKLKDLIENKGGKLLTPYENRRTKVKVECPKGHIWETFPPIIEGGSWCPKCNSKKDIYLEELRTIAKRKGGNLQSEEYINNKTKLIFQCKHGHEWSATPKSIKEGTWCPICYKLGLK